MNNWECCINQNKICCNYVIESDDSKAHMLKIQVHPMKIFFIIIHIKSACILLSQNILIFWKYLYFQWKKINLF